MGPNNHRLLPRSGRVARGGVVGWARRTGPRQHQAHADIYRQFGLSFDDFGRTSSETNRGLTQAIFRRLDERGFIVARSVR